MSGAAAVVHETPMLDAALEYARLRWPVLPLYGIRPDGSCQCGAAPGACKIGKHPRTLHGLSEASIDPARVSAWWARWPDANVAIVCGAVSGITAFDIDPRNGGRESFARLVAQIGELYPTVTARTGSGGNHLLFAHPGAHVKTQHPLKGFPGLDVQGDGAYIVAAPSRHVSGQSYRWEAAPGEIKMQPFPPKVLEMINRNGGNGHGPAAAVKGAIVEGGRNDTLTSTGGSMRRAGLERPEIEAALLCLNARACSPPLPDAEVRDVAKSVARYPRGGEVQEPTEIVPLTFADLTAPPQPAPPALVGRPGCTLIPTAEKVALVGDPGSGKSHLLVDLAIGIAAGRDVLDLACLQGPTLYITSDDDPHMVSKFQRHAAGLGLDLGELPLRLVTDPGFNLDEPGTMARVRKALADLGADTQPATLIIESLTTNVLPDLTDLFDGVSVRAYVRRNLAALQSDFPGLSIIMSHHLKKAQAGGANDLSTRVSGSVQIRAGFDCVIGLVPDGAEAFGVRTLKRSRSGGRFDSFKVRIVGEPGAPVTLKNDGGVDVSETELQGASGAVLAFLKAAGGPRPLKEIVAGVTGFRTRAVQTACSKLAEGESPRLVRTSKRPAVYVYAPPKQPDLGGLD